METGTTVGAMVGRGLGRGRFVAAALLLALLLAVAMALVDPSPAGAMMNDGQFLCYAATGDANACGY